MPPLDGIRVVDLTRVVAGPFCTMMLGDMGAEVLKIEEPAHGDDTRGWGPFINGTGAFYFELNRSKKSVALDLKTADGAAALRRLIETADILIENFRPGSLAGLGFDYASASAINPRLIYCSIAGYGQTGPHAQLPGYDAVIQGEAGIMEMTGFPGGDPTRVGVAITDYLAGLYAVQGILLALYERTISGRGQHVDIALFDADPRRERSPDDRAVRTAACERRTPDRRRREPSAMGALLHGNRSSRPVRRCAFQNQCRSDAPSRRAQARARDAVRVVDGRRADPAARRAQRALRSGANDAAGGRASAGGAARPCRAADASGGRRDRDARPGRQAVADAGRADAAAAGARRTYRRSARGDPTRVGVAITDYLAGLYAVQGILLALYERTISGRGQHVDIALFDA
ncbi:MAG: CoA transferase, partial [Acidobacteria bacterium]|nr:CoA transferase [Acidobacteriota bacterium]